MNDIYCEECKWYTHFEYWTSEDEDGCVHPQNSKAVNDPVHRDATIPVRTVAQKNKNNDCECFKQKWYQILS